MVDPNTRQGKRTPVTLKIKFKSETLEQFIERYAVDVSQGGIFIRTKEPLAVGTQMKFEFQLRDASPLIAGEGTVVWTRENDPSRPAIAPGMGVRFDRLADGSQGILERILTEKAKQAPQRPAPETTKPPLFTDTPTRVAPAPMQEALLGKDNGRRRDDAGHSDSHTPLPKPMPFHSDADEFPDEAFEEATKVRALDELIAQTAEDDSKPENTSRGRVNGRGDATAVDPTNERPEPRPLVLPPQELQEVPDLPNPPEMLRPPPRMLDNLPPRF
ncbi:MAG TPA: TIGR02266 family protein, partial [Kofleriaceae bacterium]